LRAFAGAFRALPDEIALLSRVQAREFAAPFSGSDCPSQRWFGVLLLFAAIALVEPVPANQDCQPCPALGGYPRGVPFRAPDAGKGALLKSSVEPFDYSRRSLG